MSLLKLALALSMMLCACLPAQANSNWNPRAITMEPEVHWVTICGRSNNSSSELLLRQSVEEHHLYVRRLELRQAGYFTAVPGEVIHYNGEQGIVQYNCQVKVLHDPTIALTMIFSFMVIAVFFVCFPRHLSLDCLEVLLQPTPTNVRKT